MTTRKLFLSYRRGALTTPAVKRLHDHCRVLLKGRGFETFFDQRSIEAGDLWLPAIDTFLAEAEFFLAFISIDYWLSDQCRRELSVALERFEATGRPRPLFVLADRLDPNDLEVDAPDGALDNMAGAGTAVQRIRHIGQINFLGPYDEATGRLVRLRLDDAALLEDQIAALVEAIKKLPAR